MMGLAELLVCFVAAALPLFGVGLVLLLVRGTQQKTSMGLNLSVPSHCPKCGAALPSVRTPKTFRQAMFGGWTCAGCGVELDKWGRPQPPASGSRRIGRAVSEEPPGDRRHDFGSNLE